MSGAARMSRRLLVKCIRQVMGLTMPYTLLGSASDIFALACDPGLCPLPLPQAGDGGRTTAAPD